jgi:hypothetical protein
MEVVLRMDALAQTAEELMRLASDVARLAHLTTAANVLDILGFVAMRHRTNHVLQKHLHNVVTRTGWLSFIAEQAWSQETKDRLSSMSKSELKNLLGALSEESVDSLLQALDL